MMAKSSSHQFGQIIGNVLERAIEPWLRDFAQTYRLYLDKKGKRSTRRGVKVSWPDEYGNIHDLDFVLEKEGTLATQGIPVAFIELAWRRYTKHSRNKAQEIQGAILPIVAKQRYHAPFMGAILAGDFTSSAIDQLRSNRFEVLHLPYRSIVDAFGTVGVNAHFGESTTEGEFTDKVLAWNALSEDQKTKVASSIIGMNEEAFGEFSNTLARVVGRQVEHIIVLPLHGTAIECPTADDAISCINEYREDAKSGAFVRYEIQIRYSNGNLVSGEFGDKTSAVEFLHMYLPLPSEG